MNNLNCENSKLMLLSYICEIIIFIKIENFSITMRDDGVFE